MTGIEHTVVDTERGKVRGAAEGEAISFRGIPYAASPVGELRFARPQPHPGWTDVRDAAQAGASVPQAASRLEKGPARTRIAPRSSTPSTANVCARRSIRRTSSSFIAST